MLISLIRTVILYVVVTFCVRVMGKRQVGELQNSELVITLLVSELAAIPMQEPGIPLLSGIVPMLTLVVCELLVSALMMKSRGFRRLMCGSPVAVIRNGQLEPGQMKRLRMTVEDLAEELRQHDVFDLSEVAFAAVETSGQLSVMKKASKAPPSAEDLKVSVQNAFAAVVICNGDFCPHSAALCGCTAEWAQRVLKKENCAMADVFLMTADTSGNYNLVRRDGTPRKGGRKK